MFEFLCRLLLSAGILALPFVAGAPSFDEAWKAAALFAAVALVGFRLEARGIRNPGVAGIIGVIDAATAAFLLVSAGAGQVAGFSVLIPLAYAAMQHNASMLAMTPIAAGSLLMWHALLAKDGTPSAELMVQVFGVLIVGFLTPQRRVEQVVVQGEAEEREPIAIGPNIDAFLDLRENFRTLRDQYRELERKSRRDRLAVQLYETGQAQGERFYPHLAATLQRVLGIQNLALYTLAQLESALVVRTATGSLAKDLGEAKIEIDTRSAPIMMLENTERAVRALQSEDNTRIANVILSHQGKVVGMLCLSSGEADVLRDAREIAEEIVHFIVAMIREHETRESSSRRLRETELLYEVAALAPGAEDEDTLAARACRELRDLLQVDHVGLHLISRKTVLTPAEVRTVAVDGFPAEIVDSLRFPSGTGAEGWIFSGAPELVLFDARDGSRCDGSIAVRKRIGSFAIIPLGDPANPAGFITVATHHAGGIDAPHLGTLRVVAAELGRTLEAMQGAPTASKGITLPSEFGITLARGQRGHLVTLEPIRLENLIQNYGRPAIAHAMRRFAARVRAKLPTGAAICRRSGGDYLVFLPTTDHASAESWANEVAAMASMIGIRTPDGSERIPLAVRARVTVFDKQQHELLDRLSA